MSAAGFRPDADELRARRRALAARVVEVSPPTTPPWAAWRRDDGGRAPIVLVRGAPPSATTFRQTNDFYYLCGVEVPSAYLLVDAGTAEATLYLPRRSEAVETGIGRRLSAEDVDDARALSGVDAVKPIDELAGDLARRVKRDPTTPVFTPLAPAEGTGQSRDTVLDPLAEASVDPFARALTPEASFVEALRRLFPTLVVHDASGLLDEARSVKSPSEIEALREAGRLSALSVIEAMRSTAPGVWEYELGAVAEFVYRRGGAFGSAYEPIVATGANIWFGHYGAKASQLREGELILMDAAPDFRYYASDIGRIWPVSGRWEPWQRVLYGFIVRYHRELLARIRPGVTNEDVLRGAAEVMRGVLAETEFVTAAHERGARDALDFPFHLSHPVGMAVHDNGEYRGRPLEPGHVFSVDPMLWVPEERLYIRCEDTVVVTENGCENLTSLAPLDPDDVIRVMGEPGLLER